jgi:hypothetical protein
MGPIRECPLDFGKRSPAGFGKKSPQRVEIRRRATHGEQTQIFCNAVKISDISPNTDAQKNKPGRHGRSTGLHQ